MTVGRVAPVRRAISVFVRPSADIKTIRARWATLGRGDTERANASRRPRSPSRRVNGAAAAIPHPPVTQTVKQLSTHGPARDVSGDDPPGRQHVDPLDTSIS